MMNKELVFSSFQSIRHQIITLYVHRKEIQILKLLDVLKSHQLGLGNKQYHHINKFVTGEVFPQRHHNKLLTVRKTEAKFKIK